MTDNFEFRSIHPDEVEQAIAIEQICFPPNEACSPKAMTERIAKVPQLFLVAVDKSTGKLAGFLNGVATDEEKFRDEFFTDIDLCDENGKNVMLLGLDVLPEYRGCGIGRALETYAVNISLEQGYTPFGQVVEDNLVSVKLQESLGLYFAKDKVYWVESKS